MAFNAAAVKPQENGGVDSPQPTPAALTPPAAAAAAPSAPASSKEDQRHAIAVNASSQHRLKAAAGLLLCMQRLCDAERADLCHVQPNDSAACSVSRLCRAIIMQRLAALREKEAAQRAAAAPPRYLPCKTASQNNLVPVQPHARYALPGLQSVQHHSAICQRIMSLLVLGKMSLQLILCY